MLLDGLAKNAGTRLFAIYAVASLVPVAVLGAVLGQGIRQDAVDRALEWGRTQGAVVEEMVIAPALSGGDLAGGLSPADLERLQGATDLAIFRGSVERLRLRDFDGNVLFADDGRLVTGRTAAGNDPGDAAVPVPPASAPFRAAIRGGTDVVILGDDDRVVRVVQPVIVNASGRSAGVLEVVFPYAAIAGEVEAAARDTYVRLTAGLGVLYVVLAAISWSSSRRLRREAAQSAHAALHDSLTGLPNRELFHQRLEQATKRPDPCAVVLVDLDRFKEINDTIGHQAGDQVLREVGARLTSMLRAGDTVARLGGDEFGLLLPDVEDAAAARELVQRVAEAMEADLVVVGVPLTVEASFGIALHPVDGSTAEDLLTCADAAMYRGKRGTTAVVLFDAALASPPSDHLSVQHDIRHAIERDELRLEYQPQIDLRSGRTVGVEALVRWQHPDRGLLPPSAFLPAVEQAAVMRPLTEWVVARALADCAAWTADGRSWRVSVNVSVRNLNESDFAATVARLTAEAGLAPDRLRIEVTETALPVDPVVVARTLAELASAGFGTALDDFGVGYASLSHLRSLDLTEVKIDRAFVAGVTEDGEDREVVAALVQLAHGLGLSVCAEGVETHEAAMWLRAVGCDLAQGFWFSRPQPWTDLDDGSAVVPHVAEVVL